MLPFLYIVVTDFLFDIYRIKLYNYYEFLYANRVYLSVIVAKSVLWDNRIAIILLSVSVTLMIICLGERNGGCC